MITSNDNMFSLNDKVAFISGASGHLGSEMSLSMASAGAHVILNGRNIEKLNNLQDEIKSKGYSCEIANFDITKENDIKDFFSSIKKLNIIVNNAYEGKSGSIKTTNSKKYKDAFDISIVAAANILRYAYPIMESCASSSNQSSSVINISSMYGIVSPDLRIYSSELNANPPFYGAAKAALIQFTKYSACEFGAKNIRVNSISPGPFPNIENIENDDKFLNDLKNKVPLGRIGNSNEINGPLIFLASNASSYVTGSNIVVDGGWIAW